MAYDEALAERIRGALDGEPGLTERRMFGGLAFLLNGHMAVAATSEGLMLRVPPERSEELIEGSGAERMVMNGRVMSGWLVVASEAVGDDRELASWLAIGRELVRALPPK